jgi:hydroxyethylthiazole kinase-like uncharacterized protein yjeF
MKIFDTKDIRDIDAYTVRNEPVSSIELMERAAKGCAEWISGNIPSQKVINIFTGPGNNGGDGWAIARILAEKGFENISLYHLQISRIISPDAEINRQRLIQQDLVRIQNIERHQDFPILQKSDLIIDALFGSGLTRSLEGLSLGLVKHINSLGCRVISIDIPSGLFGEDNSLNPEESIIRASETLTFQFPKRAFFFSENEKFTGSWHIINIGLHPGILDEKPSSYYFTEADSIKLFLKKRKRFAHKGIHGHGMLIAGSYGMLGAAILAARACIRTGIGLLTTHVPHSGYPIMQSAVPESIFSIDENKEVFANCPSVEKFSAVAAGPGIGTKIESIHALEVLLKNCRCPLLLDADALNILANNSYLIDMLPEYTVITPHPGEFDRITGKSLSGYERNTRQISLSKERRIIIVLKGAFTSVTMPDGKCYYNSTGNPGMATAGSGDVLTGIILSLLSQGYAPGEASVLGVFIHGMAGDLAVSEQSPESLIASDIINNIGNAFNKIKKNETFIV